MSQMVTLAPAVPAVTVGPSEKRRAVLLQGPILPTILRLAAPNIVVVAVLAASSTFDAFFVGRLGSDALAGVSLVLPVWMLMVTMSAAGIGGGVSSAIARALGAGRRGDAEGLAAHAVLIALAFAAVFTMVVLWLGPTLYAAMGGTGETLTLAVAYSNVVFAGAVAVWLVNTFASVLRGSGEMAYPAGVVVAGELLHIGLAPVLVFGLGPFPSLGVTGAAISLTTSQTLRALVLARYLLVGRAAVRLDPAAFRPHGASFAAILRVGLPASVNTVLTNLNVVLLTGLVGGFGTLALAGYGIGARLEYLLLPLVFGLGTVLVTMVGTNVGAGQLERARRVAWVGAALAASLTGGVGLLAALRPEAWVGLFTSEPAVLAVGGAYLQIVGPTYALFGLGLAHYFSAQGAGRLLWPLVAGVARSMTAVLGGWIAISWFGSGLLGLFVAISLSFLVFGLAQTAAIHNALRERKVRPSYT